MKRRGRPDRADEAASAGRLSSYNLSRICLIWAIGIALLYVYDRLPEISLKEISGILPLFRPGFPPSLHHFAGKLLILLAGIGLALLSGRGVGDIVARFLRLGRLSSARSIPLGWLAVALIYFGIGLAGLWYAGLIGTLGAILVLSGLLCRSGLPRSSDGAPIWRDKLVLLPALLAAWCIILMSLAPELFQDPLRYHLFVPAQFLLAHKCFFMPHFFFWSYFGPTHALYGAAQALAGQLGAQAINIASGLLCLAGIYRIGVKMGLPDVERRLLLALTISAPGLILITGSTFVENALGLYMILAVEWLFEEGATRARRLRAIAVLAGAAFAIKYTAVFGIVGLAAAIAALPNRAAWGRALRRNFVAVGLAVIVYLPWGLWLWVNTLDPVSPILGKFGLPTLDAYLSDALSEHYAFARAKWIRWLGNPSSMLKFPLEFAGAHSNYWECPGPAIPGLLVTLLLAIRVLPHPLRSMGAFTLGGIGAWFLVFGGSSPHYIMGYAGLWLAGVLGSLSALPRRFGDLARHILFVLIFFQALLGVKATQDISEPRDVAMGVVTERQYLDRLLQPVDVAYPIRTWLNERIRKDRDRVLVYGDDHGSYIDSLVQMDTELVPGPLLWRLAETSADEDRIRLRLKQRRLTWMLFSLHWPVVLVYDERFRQARLSARALTVLQNFWRVWVDPVVGAYPPPGTPSSPTWAIKFRDTPREGPMIVDRWREPELLPGTHGWVWRSVEYERKRKIRKAMAEYRGIISQYPNYAFARFGIARLLIEQGREREAREHLAAAAREGWLMKGYESFPPGRP